VSLAERLDESEFTGAKDRIDDLISSTLGPDLSYHQWEPVPSNHLHLVLRGRPDVVERWSDEQIARRWLRLYLKRKRDDGSAEEPNRAEIDSSVNDPELFMYQLLSLSLPRSVLTL
jgi:hypothetical protein